MNLLQSEQAMKFRQIAIKKTGKISTLIKHLEATVKELKKYEEKGFTNVEVSNFSFDNKELRISIIIKKPKKEITNE